MQACTLRRCEDEQEREGIQECHHLIARTVMPELDLSISSNNMSAARPIGPKDVVATRGKYLVKADGSRFFMKGIAFPVPMHEHNYNATAWIGILHQLTSLGLNFNTVRLYRMDPAENYTDFFNAAAELGVYVIVPLTSAQGDGVLDRNKRAPRCYPKRLYRYGVKCLHNYMQYPNAIAGLLANEVMNDIDSWRAATCIKAYGRDLKMYVERTFDRPFPLIYAAQNSGIGATLDDVDTMRLTSEYLTCAPERRGKVLSTDETPSTSIDIFGVNVESWCSSLDTFEKYESGQEGGYHSLWSGLHNSSIALIFSEMGCSHLHFDHDNGLSKAGGARDWKQVSVVLNDMADTWSGFCAYTYDGAPQFDMFAGGPWQGDKPLEPTLDFFNFRDQMKNAKGNASAVYLPKTEAAPPVHLPTCSDVEQELKSCCGIEVYNIVRVKSYADQRAWIRAFLFIFILFGIVIVAFMYAKKCVGEKKNNKEESSSLAMASTSKLEVKYQSINV